MGHDFDGRLVRNDGVDTVFGALLSNNIGAHGSNSQRHHANSSTDSSSAQHIPLTCDMMSIVSLEMTFNDFALLAGVMNRRCGHGDPNRGYAEG